MGLFEILQYLRGEGPAGYLIPAQELRDKKTTLWSSRSEAPKKGMLMQVIVADNKADEALKAAGTVLERQLQDAKTSLERILQRDNDKRADNYVAKLTSDLAALTGDK